MTNKIKLHVILSTLLLLPVAIIVENSDGAESVHSIKDYFKEWLAPIALSFIISAAIFGVKRLLKKDTSILNIYYHTAYVLSIFMLLAISIKYL